MLPVIAAIIIGVGNVHFPQNAGVICSSPNPDLHGEYESIEAAHAARTADGAVDASVCKSK